MGTTDFARKADKAVEGRWVDQPDHDGTPPRRVLRTADELERLLTGAFEEAKIPMRGTREELKAAVAEGAPRGRRARQSCCPRTLPAWADAIVDADFRYNDEPALPAREAAAKGIYKAREFGSFLGSWVETAKLSFDATSTSSAPTPRPARASARRSWSSPRASRWTSPSWAAGSTDVHFHDRSNTLVTPEVYDKDHMKAVKLRSRGIILTDDYAPVENLLAPVARGR